MTLYFSYIMRETYRNTIRSLLVVLLIGVVATLYAGGTGEPTANTETASLPLDKRRSQQKELLSSIGIRVFDDRIAAVDFEVTTLEKGDTTLENLRGEFVFLNFWATWCPPCREEMPAMEAMSREFSQLPFTILAMSVQEDRDTVQRYVDEFGFTFPIGLDPTGRVASHYGVRGLPTTYFIDSDGVVLGMLIGIRDWHDENVRSVMRRVIELGEQ